MCGHDSDPFGHTTVATFSAIRTDDCCPPAELEFDPSFRPGKTWAGSLSLLRTAVDFGWDISPLSCGPPRSPSRLKQKIRRLTGNRILLKLREVNVLKG